MPELPELEVVRDVLQARVAGRRVEAVDVTAPGGPIVVRDLTGTGLAATLVGSQVAAVERVGKFVVLDFARDATSAGTTGGSGSPAVAPLLAINPKLAGRLQLARAGERRRGSTWVRIALDDGSELRYVDTKRMGQVYLARTRAEVPDLVSAVPDALAIGADGFRERLRAYRGEIKGILTRGELVSGIGNAYADEILWTARLHPYRRRTTLTPEEVDRLHAAIGSTLRSAIDRVRDAMGERIDEKPRDFLAVHMKAGLPCPRCGTAISLVGANQTITNFCRTCQPGGLVRGM